MYVLAPYADDLNLFWNAKLNDYVYSVYLAYALSLFISLVYANSLPCFTSKPAPLVYVIFAANILATSVRAMLCTTIFKKFNQMQILFTIVLSGICVVLTGIQLLTWRPWPDIVFAIIFVASMVAHAVILIKLFKRLIRMR